MISHEKDINLFTIGHSTLDFDNFAETLCFFGIRKLIDVRSYPGSRYVPQFNEKNLSAMLKADKIEYMHMPILGGRRKSHDEADYQSVAGWKNASFQNYASYTMTDAYQQGITQLIEEIQNNSICIMCAEVMPWRCHRLLIANTLVCMGVKVSHIISKTQCIEHKLNLYGAHAEIHNGRVIYP